MKNISQKTFRIPPFRDGLHIYFGFCDEILCEEFFFSMVTGIIAHLRLQENREKFTFVLLAFHCQISVIIIIIVMYL